MYKTWYFWRGIFALLHNNKTERRQAGLYDAESVSNLRENDKESLRTWSRYRTSSYVRDKQSVRVSGNMTNLAYNLIPYNMRKNTNVKLPDFLFTLLHRQNTPADTEVENAAASVSNWIKNKIKEPQNLITLTHYRNVSHKQSTSGGGKVTIFADKKYHTTWKDTTR